MKLVFFILLFSILIQQLYYWLVFSRGAFSKWSAASMDKGKAVSVVICGKNALKDFQSNVTTIVTQDHNQFEVVLVDDYSDDATWSYFEEVKSQYPNTIQLVSCDHFENAAGKKQALYAGVMQAKNDLIVVTDADCWPQSKNWLSLMVQAFNNPDTEIVLGVSPNINLKGLMKRFFAFESDWTAIFYISWAKSGLPYMGVGRNMAFRKELFLRAFPKVLNSSMASGDDDLFIQYAATDKNTALCLDADAFTYSESPNSWHSWWKQKTRHLSTGGNYHWHHQFLISIYPIAQLTYFVSLVIFVFSIYWRIALALMLINIVFKSLINVTFMKKLKHEDNAPFMPLFVTFWALTIPLIWLSSKIQSNKTWS